MGIIIKALQHENYKTFRAISSPKQNHNASSSIYNIHIALWSSCYQKVQRQRGEVSANTICALHREGVTLFPAVFLSCLDFYHICLQISPHIFFFRELALYSRISSIPHIYVFLGKASMKKKTFSFGHCPNYLNAPPPMTPIRATWSSFFGSRNSRFESQFRTKNIIYTI